MKINSIDKRELGNEIAQNWMFLKICQMEGLKTE